MCGKILAKSINVISAVFHPYLPFSGTLFALSYRLRLLLI